MPWRQAGFEVQRGVAGMPTAVVGSRGPGPLHVAICAEYDALPSVGHACGHNVICTAALGAGLALAAGRRAPWAARQRHGHAGRGGRRRQDRLRGGGLLRGRPRRAHGASLAGGCRRARPHRRAAALRGLPGREAHASGFPWRGINAADAMVVAQTAIGLLRQQFQPGDRVHGIVTRGGEAANIIPAHVTADYMVRAATRARLRRAPATRCATASRRARWRPAPASRSASTRPTATCATTTSWRCVYRQHAEALGRTFSEAPSMPVSTDMGNVSYEVPSHPSLHRHRDPRRRSTTRPSSRPPARSLPPTRPSSTAPWPWPSRSSTRPATSRCGAACSAEGGRGPGAPGDALLRAQHQDVLVDDVGHEGVRVAVGPQPRAGLVPDEVALGHEAERLGARRQVGGR